MHVIYIFYLLQQNELLHKYSTNYINIWILENEELSSLHKANEAG